MPDVSLPDFLLATAARAPGATAMAFVVPAAGVAADEATARQLIEYVAGRVAPHKRIREIAFTDAIPVTPSGKVLRRVLAAAGGLRLASPGAVLAYIRQAGLARPCGQRTHIAA
jgi:acyl-CoA synthetase (AMP-forming)/AMP-acid ligase II